MSIKAEHEQWSEVGALLVSALDLPDGERSAFLDEACRSRPDLRAAVDEMIDAYEKSATYFGKLGVGLLPVPEDDDGLYEPNEPPDPYGLIGQRIGRYEITALLGGGGMGVVYRAEDTQLGRTVALKFLPPHLGFDEASKARFLQEAQAASALDHPNICTIYEVGETPDARLFIAMACYDGETLKQRVSRGAMAVDEILDLAIQIGQALVKSHAQGIVHRDVKPANVMITEDGLAKLLDFGLAKLAGGAHITRTGATIGTAAYMSPEQARGEMVDHRTDIWALGVMLYEMLARRRPFEGSYGPAVIYSVLNEDPTPIMRDGLPLQLGQAVEKALAKLPENRYQHASELVADLEALRSRRAAQSMMREEVLPAPAAPDSNPVEGPDDGPPVILVVDDEPELELLIRQRFRKAIRSEEWRFEFAGDGREALEVVERNRDIALVLTDLNMPGMDGLTLLKHLAVLDRPIKTVVVSAYGDLANIRVAMNRGAFDFVTKPIDFNDLQTTIRKTHGELVAYRKATSLRQQLQALQKEMDVARRIQDALLPVAFPESEYVEGYAFTTGARDVGGVFYDYYPIDSGQIGFLIGEVASKGVAAALTMAICQAVLRGTRGVAPGEALTNMNRLLSDRGFPEQRVTVFLGHIDTKTGEVVYASAAHPVPYVLHAGEAVSVLANPGPTPLWQDADHVYATNSVHLKPGDGLFLYTGGLVAAADENGHAFSTDRLASQLRTGEAVTPPHVIRRVVRAVMEYAAEETDDLAVLAFRYLG